MNYEIFIQKIDTAIANVRAWDQGGRQGNFESIGGIDIVEDLPDEELSQINKEMQRSSEGDEEKIIVEINNLTAIQRKCLAKVMELVYLGSVCFLDMPDDMKTRAEKWYNKTREHSS